jgi:hypothetical protein
MTEHKKRFEKIMGKLEEKAGKASGADQYPAWFEALDEITRDRIISRYRDISCIEREIVNLMDGKAADAHADLIPASYPEDRLTDQHRQHLRARAEEGTDSEKNVQAIVLSYRTRYRCSVCNTDREAACEFWMYVGGKPVCWDCAKKVAPRLEDILSKYYLCCKGKERSPYCQRAFKCPNCPGRESPPSSEQPPAAREVTAKAG